VSALAAVMAAVASSTVSPASAARKTFGWWDEPEQTMNLLEVKDYSDAPFNAEHYVNECIQKATDCLLLLASIWYDLPYGPRIKGCLPDEWHTLPVAPPRLHLFFVIKESLSTDAEQRRIPSGWTLSSPRHGTR
jgi:hypothetical protein